MTTGLLAAAVVLLSSAVLLQWRAKRKRDRHLAYIHEKIKSMTDGADPEQLLMFTEDRGLRTLLGDLNRLLRESGKLHAERLRSEQSMKKLLSNMSHDLRTPLTVVLGLAETAVHDPSLDDGERKRLLLKLHAKAEEIVRLINQFFDLARLEAGDRELPLSSVAVGAVCESNLLFFYEAINEAGLRAEIELPDIPLYAVANEEALNRILQNLISNAIRYGSEGKVLGLRLGYDDEYVYITVWDRGRGIQEAQQRLVFDRLYTLEDSRNPSFQGSGLGLSITKRLAELLHGTVTLRSVPYEETAFTVRLARAGG